MAMLPDKAAFQERLGALPLTTYKAGETILTAGSKTGLLLILKSGKVAVIKDQVKIAKIAESGALFGELSALLNQPHAADVYALEASQFHVADAEALLKEDPVALLYVAAVLARRLDSANRTLVELKTQVQTGQPGSEIGRTIQKMERLLSPGASSLVYAGYPYDPFDPSRA
jgi:CRP-like cAMP-binding protein